MKQDGALATVIVGITWVLFPALLVAGIICFVKSQWEPGAILITGAIPALAIAIKFTFDRFKTDSTPTPRAILRRSRRGHNADAPLMSGGSNAECYLVDVKEIIEDYAWHMYLDISQLTKKPKRYNREEVVFELIYDGLAISHEEPNYTLSSSRIPTILWQTSYPNRTPLCQKNVLKADPRVESIFQIQKEHGFYVGPNSLLQLAVPVEVNELGGMFASEESFKMHAAGDKVVHVNPMAVERESVIEVPPEAEIVAEFSADIMKYTGSFTVKSCLTGKATVNIYCRETDELVTTLAASMADIFSEVLQSHRFHRNLRNVVTIFGRNVMLETKGTCKFSFAVNQRLQLAHKDLVSPSLNSTAIAINDNSVIDDPGTSMSLIPGPSTRRTDTNNVDHSSGSSSKCVVQ